ncbi:MAG: MCE family protein [Solirubrobacterales bacterium]|nr:MCE family protein [Solirubrobacterales bacterium]
MNRGRAQSLAASPALVGALTVLIITVAVFLAYNANQGLPFVPTYRISAEVPNAVSLVPGNEVRIGGVRVGAIDAIVPEQSDDGTISAKLDLSLNQEVRPLPDNSTMIVRSRSSLGLKYLEINKGDSEQGFDEGATIPLSAARPEPVDLDQLFNTFDTDTRKASQVNLREFGDTLAGRGASLNEAIGALRPVVARLTPVMSNLASPSTDLAGFVRGLTAAAGEVAPVAEQQASLFVGLDTTFGALANVSRPFIQETITKSVPTLELTQSALPKINPFLVHSAEFFHALQPGARALRANAKTIKGAIVEGVPALRASPAFNAQLDPTAQALLDLANDVPARQGLDELTVGASTLNPTLAFITPAQSICNYASILVRNLNDTFKFGNSLGTWQQGITIIPRRATTTLVPNSQFGPSSAPASASAESLHFNPYPNTAAPGQTFECEAGNETGSSDFVAGTPLIGNVPGNQGVRTSNQTDKQRAGKQ